MTAHTDLDAREALADRLVDATTHALETLSVHLGLELGFYQALNHLGAATEAEVAAHTGVAPRYAREWLEQQTVAGYLTCDNPSDVAEQRRYQLPPGHAEVLLDADSPDHAAPLAGILAGVAAVLPQLLAAYRTGGASPTPPTGRSCGAGSPRSTGRCSCMSWPAPGCPPCPTWTGGCGRPHRPWCSTWAAA
jgi:hypothetical protein